MTYQTIEPGKELSMLVKCYWTLDGPKEDIPYKQRIVPDGCMEMIFHYGDLYKQYTDDNNYLVQPRCFVFGQLTAPLEIEATGITSIFSVRFQSEGFAAFSAMPVKQMENTATSLEKVFGADGTVFENTMLHATTIEEKVSITEKFLLGRLTDATTFDRVVSAAVSTILEVNGQLSVDQLSEKININRRQLERKFSTATGLSPKQLSKIIRLQAVLKLLLSGRFKNFSDLAYEGEYYDQAHFIKDFREFTGYTPKEFFGGHIKMSSLFYGE